MPTTFSAPIIRSLYHARETPGSSRPSSWARPNNLTMPVKATEPSPDLHGRSPSLTIGADSVCMPKVTVNTGHGAFMTKTTTAKTAAKAVAGKKALPPKVGAVPNALQKPLQPSQELAAVVGREPLPRGEVVSKVWQYIKANNLQNPQNKREIVADDRLQKVFGKDKVTMFEMSKYLAQHLA